MRRLGRRPTRAEFRERVDLTRRLVADGRPKADIKRALRRQFGHLSARTVERYLARARAPARPSNLADPGEAPLVAAADGPRP